MEKLVEQRARIVASAKEATIASKIKEDYEEEIAAITKEAEEDRRKAQELKTAAIENAQLKRKLESQEADLELAYEEKMTAQLKLETEATQRRLEGNYDLKLREKEEIIERQKKEVDDMKRRLEVGSSQLRGEAQELVIEEWLAEQFPLDSISEIKKGARGADCLQTVHTREAQNCGTIYYESKRTKDFQKSWIEKFRTDMRAKGADLGVLVTEAMPPDMERMEFRDGVLICSVDEFKAACFLLRERIIAVNAALVSQENRGDKMNILYDYLIGNEFRMSVEGIVEAFTRMQEDLLSEQRAMKTLWAIREKRISAVIENTTRMFGSIRGIAGKEIQSIPALELTPGETAVELLPD